MRSMFLSKFGDVLDKHIQSVLPMINTGGYLYEQHIPMMNALVNITGYNSISDIYDKLNMHPGTSLSKRELYSRYACGIVVGAGAGNECNELIHNPNWFLYDLQDERMVVKALGYDDANVKINITTALDGTNMVNTKNKYIDRREEIQVSRLDSLKVEDCALLSIDAEGTGLDVIAGALNTIDNCAPDILVAIYHNWLEYLLIIPLLYDMGYTINIVKTVSALPHQPHLDLCVYAER